MISEDAGLPSYFVRISRMCDCIRGANTTDRPSHDSHD